MRFPRQQNINMRRVCAIAIGVTARARYHTYRALSKFMSDTPKRLIYPESPVANQVRKTLSDLRKK